jgi:hypothetical protein
MNGPASHDAPRASLFEVWRQDENGNLFLVAAFASQQEARGLLARFEAMHHEQTYWIEPR